MLRKIKKLGIKIHIPIFLPRLRFKAFHNLQGFFSSFILQKAPAQCEPQLVTRKALILTPFPNGIFKLFDQSFICSVDIRAQFFAPVVYIKQLQKIFSCLIIILLIHQMFDTKVFRRVMIRHLFQDLFPKLISTFLAARRPKAVPHMETDVNIILIALQKPFCQLLVFLPFLSKNAEPLHILIRMINAKRRKVMKPLKAPFPFPVVNLPFDLQIFVYVSIPVGLFLIPAIPV